MAESANSVACDVAVVVVFAVFGLVATLALVAVAFEAVVDASVFEGYLFFLCLISLSRSYWRRRKALELGCRAWEL